MKNPDKSSTGKQQYKQVPITFETFLLVIAGLVSVAFVEAFYRLVVNIRYSAFVKLVEAGQIPADSTSIWVALNGFEQKITLMLFLLSLALLVYKFFITFRERGLLQINFLNLKPGRVVEREEALDLVYEMENQLPQDLPKPFSFILPSFQDSLLARTFRRALTRYHEDESAGTEEVSHSISAVCEGEMVKYESQLAMINYIAWAIPSVGFIGTVRGIAQALSKAGEVASGGDVTPVTDALGLAFNSTLIALIVSMFLMFFIHALRRMQEGFVIDVENYIQEKIISIL